MNKELSIEEQLIEILDDEIDFDEWATEASEKTELLNRLLSLIRKQQEKVIDKCIELADTHTEHEGAYCDTSDDMDWACRSECVEMAIERMEQYKSKIKSEGMVDTESIDREKTEGNKEIQSTPTKEDIRKEVLEDFAKFYDEANDVYLSVGHYNTTFSALVKRYMNYLHSTETTEKGEQK